MWSFQGERWAKNQFALRSLVHLFLLAGNSSIVKSQLFHGPLYLSILALSGEVGANGIPEVLISLVQLTNSASCTIKWITPGLLSFYLTSAANGFVGNETFRMPVMQEGCGKDRSDQLETH